MIRTPTPVLPLGSGQAFINPRAISAGALISLATKHIVMVEGGTIGSQHRDPGVDAVATARQQR